jgi:hypothetical protein
LLLGSTDVATIFTLVYPGSAILRLQSAARFRFIEHRAARLGLFNDCAPLGNGPRMFTVLAAGLRIDLYQLRTPIASIAIWLASWAMTLSAWRILPLGSGCKL